MPRVQCSTFQCLRCSSPVWNVARHAAHDLSPAWLSFSFSLPDSDSLSVAGVGACARVVSSCKASSPLDARSCAKTPSGSVKIVGGSLDAAPDLEGVGGILARFEQGRGCGQTNAGRNDKSEHSDRG